MRRILVPLLTAVIALSAGGAAALTQRDKIEPLLGIAPADSSAAAAAEPTEFGSFLELEGVVINPRGSGGQRYLMAKVGVESPEQATLDRLTVLAPAAQDAVITILGSQSVAELSDVVRRDSLKGAIRDEFNQMLGKDGEVTRIYFTQYVLQ